MNMIYKLCFKHKLNSTPYLTMGFFNIQVSILSSSKVLQRCMNLQPTWERDVCWFANLKKMEKVENLPRIGEQELVNNVKNMGVKEC